jgi:hypothetical protein
MNLAVCINVYLNQSRTRYAGMMTLVLIQSNLFVDIV